MDKYLSILFEYRKRLQLMYERKTIINSKFV